MVHSEVLRWVGLLCGVVFLACYGAAYWLGLPLNETPHAVRPLVHKLVLIGTVNLAVLLCVLMFAKRRTDPR